jgi:serine/threonine-protein kinase
LTHAGLNVGSQTSACSSQFTTGLVSAQNPPGGVNVQPNTPVNIVVSSGSCVSVPGVIGQTANSAQNAITGAGLVPNTTFDTSCANGAQPGNVDNQNPAQGTQVANGTTVNISVCQGATTTTASSTTTSTTSSTTSSTAGNQLQGGGPGAGGPGPTKNHATAR